MLARLVGIPIFVRLVQKENAPCPMLVTLLGIARSTKFVWSWNAQSPMPVTGKPLMVLGMLTVLPEPVYPVIVMLIAKGQLMILVW